ncbi:2-oxo acid dehydrogenase subunit E2 [Variovorax guangxiensis]|uniref:2-oxo acid dehydrogenase subunit E2 n=1 Tax=Variovorax guangxiensis TaxID=1775474 RepID=UPI0028620F19|nr:2-oxo acid dehydrogenase subunit E2 [Variovorax guangxiensis]MDR6855918.1 pyruvate dehydrogenase E2 component (dihydrolipoamide acetyltransferase) [Variovorax guangxiensis]
MIGADLPAWPAVDFAAFGEVELKPLSRIQGLTAGFLSRNWLSIPHVTHQDDADITAAEALRATLAPRPSALAFFAKALVSGLKAFPQFNASLDASGRNLVLKKYFHIGIAIDTPRGLVVGVVRDCDRKPLAEIAADVSALSAKARGRGLPMSDMEGGCISISSLGGIGGTGFTPIVNAPEVAILGIAKAEWKPRRGSDDAIEWRLKAPLSLSYDHRVINGADAARFLRHLDEVLAEPQQLLL